MLRGAWIYRTAIAPARVELLIEYLYDKVHATEGKNALALFLNVLQDNIPPDDDCHGAIGKLAPRLATKPDLAEPVAAASQNVVLYEKGPVISRPDELFGREAQLRQLDKWLAQARRVLLFGLAGSGKTALAATAAERFLARQQRPVIWLECAHMDTGTAFDELAQRLGTAEEKQTIHRASGTSDLKAVHAMLSHYPGCLLVLDNVWNGRALYEVLQAIPEEMPVLVTSRTAFAFSFDELMTVDELDPEAALALLVAHAGGKLPDRREALQLCEQLGYHAYALEIAGTLLKGARRSPGQLLRRSRSMLHVPALLDENLEALDEAARDAFVALGGLFAPGATPELLAAYQGIDVDRAWALLDTLDQHSLARFLPLSSPDAGQGARADFYRLHDITFSYARALHEENGRDPRWLLDAVLAYLGEDAGNFEAVQRDLPNILAAARTAQEIDPGALVEIVRRLALGGYADNRGYNLELIRRLEAAIAVVRAQPEDPERLHYLLGKLGNATFGRGEGEKALALYQEALALAPNELRAVLLEAIVGKVQAQLGQAE